MAVEGQILLDDDDSNRLCQQVINERDDLCGTTSQPTEFGHQQRVAGVQAGQQLIQSPILLAATRRHVDGDEIGNLKLMCAGVIEDLQSLAVEVLFVGGSTQEFGS